MTRTIWGEAPIVYSSDPTTGATADRLFTITTDGGDHCTERADRAGCGLNPDHDGLHVPVADELLADGIRLHIAAVLTSERGAVTLETVCLVAIALVAVLWFFGIHVAHAG